MSQRKNDNAVARNRAIRRDELRRIVPLGDTTIYEMERRGEFPRRFNLTPRCVAWNRAEVEAWLEARAGTSGAVGRAPPPDVHQRGYRPVRTQTPKGAGGKEDLRTYRGVRLQKAVGHPRFPREVLEQAVRVAIAKNRDRLAKM